MRGAVASSEGLHCAEDTGVPVGTNKVQAKLDPGLARTVIAVGPVGLGVTTVAFAGCPAFHLWKPLKKATRETAKWILTSDLSSYKGGFEQKTSRREADLIFRCKSIGEKAKIRTAHRRIMILDHPDKSGSPYLVTKINEAKDMLESSAKN
ncbi:LOW QUALITY PROTEIN: dnaJ homolog subfamily C member 15-like [Phaethornis superciliosus]